MLSRSSQETQYTGNSLFEAWKALPRKEKAVFLGSLIKVKRYREDFEDLIDIAIAEERSKEPSRPLEDVLRERRADRKA